MSRARRLRRHDSHRRKLDSGGESLSLGCRSCREAAASAVLERYGVLIGVFFIKTILIGRRVWRAAAHQQARMRSTVRVPQPCERPRRRTLAHESVPRDGSRLFLGMDPLASQDRCRPIRTWVGLGNPTARPSISGHASSPPSKSLSGCGMQQTLYLHYTIPT